MLAKGWGYAQLVPNSIQADNGAGLTQGIIGLVNKGQPRKLDDWGALAAWAWGASRALDYFETDKARRREAGGHRGPFAIRQGDHRRHGVRPALCDRLREFVRRRRREAAPPQVRRAGGERRSRPTSTTGWRATTSSTAGHWDALPVDSHELIALVRAAPGVHQRRRHRRRRLGGCEGQLPRRRRRGSRVHAARQEGSGRHRVPADRHDARSPATSVSVSTPAATPTVRPGRRSSCSPTGTSRGRSRGHDVRPIHS